MTDYPDDIMRAAEKATTNDFHEELKRREDLAP